MALAYECDECGTRWPNSREWAICPRCSERCRTAVVPQVMSNGQAREQLKRVKFERMYAERERDRERNGSPSPEDIGKREAYELIKRWHDVRIMLDG